MTSKKDKAKKSSKISKLFIDKPWLKWLSLSILIASLIFVGRTFYQRQQRNKQFDLMQKQRQLMIDALKEQGLSEEEIQEKMKESRPTRSPDQKTPEGFDPMRMGGQMRKMAR